MKDARLTNNFGLLRLLFAAFVVVSHSSELVDGNRSRETLSRIFGTMSIAEVGLDGFFIISGYLITKSFAEHPDVISFLIKRSARILPGYLASFWLCVLVLAPLVGGHPVTSLVSNLDKCFSLSPPVVPGSFLGLTHPELDEPIWSIGFECCCYLLVVIVGFTGVSMRLSLSRSRWFLLGSLFVLIYATYRFYGSGESPSNLRIALIFGSGANFYLFRDYIPLRFFGAIGAFVLLPVMLCSWRTAEIGMALLGAYLICWFALKRDALKISALVNHHDISYGLYLYAWPIQNLIIWHYRHINPWLLCLLTLAAAGTAGFISWHLLEKHALSAARECIASFSKQQLRSCAAEVLN